MLFLYSTLQGSLAGGRGWRVPADAGEMESHLWSHISGRADVESQCTFCVKGFYSSCNIWYTERLKEMSLSTHGPWDLGFLGSVPAG